MEPHVAIALAAFARPFLALFVFGICCLGGRILVERFMQDGQFKRLLLWAPFGRKKTSGRAHYR